MWITHELVFLIIQFSVLLTRKEVNDCLKARGRKSKIEEPRRMEKEPIRKLFIWNFKTDGTIALKVLAKWLRRSFFQNIVLNAFRYTVNEWLEKRAFSFKKITYGTILVWHSVRREQTFYSKYLCDVLGNRPRTLGLLHIKQVIANCPQNVFPV